VGILIRHGDMHVITIVLFMGGSSWGIIFHPAGEPDRATWTDRPPESVVGRWGNNASCVAISPNCVITTRHQGCNIRIPVVMGGQTYRISRLWLHDTADLCVAELDGAHWNRFVALNEDPYETGSPCVIAGYGMGRGALRQTAGLVYGYAYDGLANETLRMGTNRIDGLARQTDSGDPIPDTLVADFDGLLRKDSTPWECIPAVYDSGGGWFVSKGSAWKLAGLSQSVEVHYVEGHQDDPNFLIPYEAWFAKKSNPILPDPDLFESVRIYPYVPWIKPILSQALKADFNLDGIVNYSDFALLSEYWNLPGCQEIEGCPQMESTPSDGALDLADLVVFAEHWLWSWQP
jgi:hypothetical protein